MDFFTTPALEDAELQAIKNSFPDASIYTTAEIEFVLNIISGAYTLHYLTKAKFNELFRGFPVEEQPFKRLVKSARKKRKNPPDVWVVRAGGSEVDPL